MHVVNKNVLSRILGVGLVIFGLISCTSTPLAPSEEPSNNPSHEGALPPIIRPDVISAPATLQAVSSLVVEGWAQYRAGQWHEAIATAERGLRIQRRVAELYLLLARAYLGLDNSAQARVFARQGLRYSEGKDPGERGGNSEDRKTVKQQLQELVISLTP